MLAVYDTKSIWNFIFYTFTFSQRHLALLLPEGNAVFKAEIRFPRQKHQRF